MDQKQAMLAKVPLFAGLGARELEAIGRLCDEIDLPAGHVLIREGAAGNEFFIVIDGSVDVTRDGRPLRALGPGEFLGEIALVDRGPRTATATTLTPTRALVLGIREFHSLMDSSTAIQRAILQTLAARIRRLEPETAT